MIEYKGVKIPSTLEELVDPKHTVLLVIDPQKDISGEMRPETMYPKMAENLVPLVEVARKAGVRIIYTQVLVSPHTRAAANWYMIMKIRNEKDPGKIKDFVVEGTDGAEFVDQLKPKPEDLVIKKYRNSAFLGTPLDLVLRRYGINTIVVTGCQTDGCVESTVRDATYSLDYFVVLVEDCLASFSRENHDAMMKVMRSRHDVVNSKLLAHVWSGKTRGTDLITG